jgi:hypothetical protein
VYFFNRRRAARPINALAPINPAAIALFLSLLILFADSWLMDYWHKTGKKIWAVFRQSDCGTNLEGDLQGSRELPEKKGC